MKIYVDYIMLINFFFDFIMLLTTSWVVKQYVSIKRIINGAFIGGLSILILFINLNQFEMFLFKVIISFFMIYLTFGYKSITYFLKNTVYLYIVSILLGGTIYFINNQFSYKKSGLIFINNNYSANIIIIIILVPLFSYFYMKALNKAKNYHQTLYQVSIQYGPNKITATGFMDTGNNLIDPTTNKKVILLDQRKVMFQIKHCIKVPYYNASGLAFLKCFKPTEVLIDNKKYNDILVGISPLNQDNYDVLLNYKLWEE